MVAFFYQGQPIKRYFFNNRTQNNKRLSLIYNIIQIISFIAKLKSLNN
jgi:hypothetical protein